MSENVSNLWIPLRSYGEYIFGTHLTAKNKMQLQKVDSPYSNNDVNLYEEEGWECYESNSGDVTMTLDNGLIWSIECWGSILYEDFEIIGKTLEQCSLKLNVKFIDDSGDGSRFSNDDIGLTLWIESDKVESATISGIDEDESIGSVKAPG